MPVVALQLAEYTEGTRCDRAFSVVQGAGKGCTIRQDRLVGFKNHGFNQKCAIAEAIVRTLVQTSYIVR